MSRNRNHIIHYLIIAGIILLGSSLLLLFAGNKLLQLTGLIVTSVLYLAYGIIHHRLEHDLTLKIVIEYVLIGLLTIALFIFVKQGI